MNNTTAMKNILKFIIPAAALITLAASCHREEHLGEFLDAKTLIVNVSAPTMDIETKSASSQVPDSIFAYPVNETLTGEGALRFNNRAEDKFYFLIPTGSTGVLFTNISGYEEGVTASSYLSPESLFEAASDTGRSIARDVLYGIISEYSSEEPEQTVSLTRAVARITPQVRLLIGEDTLDNLSSRFDSVHVTLHNVSQGLRIGQDFTVSYFGLNEFSCGIDLGVTPCAGDSTYTFPTADGAPAGITLDLFKDNRNYRLEGILPEAIMANRDYSLTAYVRTDNTEGNFSLEDITFQEYSYVQDENEYTYSLLSFSSDNIFLNKEENSVAEFVVYSETGSWSATVPADVLSYLDIANKRTGLHATTDNNVLTGLNLDTVVVTTLSDISDNPISLIFDIPFSVSNDTITSNDVYNLPVMQSNGQRGVVDFTLQSGSNVTFKGYCDLYKINGDSTLVASTADSTTYYAESGIYRLSGPMVFSFEASYVSSISANSTTLTNVIIDDAEYLLSMDFSSAPLLTTLSLLDNGTNRYLRVLDFSGLDRLRELTVKGFSVTDSLTMGGGLPSLEYLDLNESYIETINLSGCTALNDLIINESIQNIDLSGCTALTEYTFISNQLRTLHVDRCTSLSELYIGEASNLRELTMKGADNLRLLTVDGHKDYVVNSSLDTLDLTSLPSLDSVSLISLDVLKKLETGSGIRSMRHITIEDCGLDKLDLSNCSGLQSYTFNSLDLDTLIFTGCSSLREFYTSGLSNLKYINVDGCTSMSSFYLGSSSGVNDLDLSLPALENITIQDCYYFRKLSLSGCPNLKIAQIDDCYRLNDISVDESTSIARLNIYNDADSLITLDLTGAHVDSLCYSYYCDIDTLRAANSTLQYVHFPYTAYLHELNVSGSRLKSLPNISYSNLEVLDVSHSDIETISLSGTNFSSIDVLKADSCASLKSFTLSANAVQWPSVSKLDLSGCTSLETLNINNSNNGDDTVLDTLDLSGCTSLKEVRLQGYMPLQSTGLILDGAAVNRLYMDRIGVPQTLQFSNSTAIDSLYIGTSSGGWEELLNLYVDGSDMKALYISNMGGLANVLASDCQQLETIDIQLCSNISNLDIDNTLGIKFFRLRNNNATNMASRFSISQLTSLEELYLSNIDHITRMDMRNMPMLRVLNVQRNNLSTKAMTSINCTGLTNLRELSYNNSPDSLYLDGCTSLHKLTLKGDYLEVVGLTGLTSLDTLNINSTSLTELTLPDMPSLSYLYLHRNDNMQFFHIPGQNKIQDMIFSDSKLQYHQCTLNVAPTLKYLYIDESQKSSTAFQDSLNFSNCPLLENVEICSVWHLVSMDFSGCSSLKSIVQTDSNGYTERISLEGCPSLVIADFQEYSVLNSLNIAGCESIRGLDLYNCDFDAAGLESLLDQLPALDYYDGLYRIEGCPGESTCDLSAAVEKKWTKTTNDISVDDYDL